jgi:AMMECR1 domain-containing protein
MKTMDEIAESASDALHAAYWAACDERRAAIDPDELTTHSWVVELLAEAYEAALDAEDDPDGWEEGRSKR